MAKALLMPSVLFHWRLR